jgi:hypothetical protein
LFQAAFDAVDSSHELFLQAGPLACHGLADQGATSHFGVTSGSHLDVMSPFSTSAGLLTRLAPG